MKGCFVILILAVAHAEPETLGNNRQLVQVIHPSAGPDVFNNPRQGRGHVSSFKQQTDPQLVRISAGHNVFNKPREGRGHVYSFNQQTQFNQNNQNRFPYYFNQQNQQARYRSNQFSSQNNRFVNNFNNGIYNRQLFARNNQFQNPRYSPSQNSQQQNNIFLNRQFERQGRFGTQLSNENQHFNPNQQFSQNQQSSHNQQFNQNQQFRKRVGPIADFVHIPQNYFNHQRTGPSPSVILA